MSIFPGIVHLREYVGKRNYIEENLLPDPHFFLMRRYDSSRSHSIKCALLIDDIIMHVITCRDDDVFIDARPSTLVSW